MLVHRRGVKWRRRKKRGNNTVVGEDVNMQIECRVGEGRNGRGGRETIKEQGNGYRKKSKTVERVGSRVHNTKAEECTTPA